MLAVEIVSGWGAARGHDMPPLYKRFRFPAEVISHAVWLYHRFPLSYREVEELLLVRQIVVSHETIRAWCDRFGSEYAASLRRRRRKAGDKWHLDEVFIKVSGVRQYLWRAVDQDGHVLDILVQCWRDAKAARRFMGTVNFDGVSDDHEGMPRPSPVCGMSTLRFTRGFKGQIANLLRDHLTYRQS